MTIADKLTHYNNVAKTFNAQLIAVSKTQTIDAINEAYLLGQRDFGENYVQELVTKAEQLPKDIRWHFIGHLQRNKIKFIAPFVYRIHGIDSVRLLEAVNKEAAKANRKIGVLLQIHIATEETKFGFSDIEIRDFFKNYKWNDLEYIQICGFMGMASNTQNKIQVKQEFDELKVLFDYIKTSIMLYDSHFSELSIGMSNDYELALNAGASHIRIGSAIFGERNYS